MQCNFRFPIRIPRCLFSLLAKEDLPIVFVVRDPLKPYCSSTFVVLRSVRNYLRLLLSTCRIYHAMIASPYAPQSAPRLGVRVSRPRYSSHILLYCCSRITIPLSSSDLTNTIAATSSPFWILTHIFINPLRLAMPWFRYSNSDLLRMSSTRSKVITGNAIDSGIIVQSRCFAVPILTPTLRRRFTCVRGVRSEGTMVLIRPYL